MSNDVLFWACMIERKIGRQGNSASEEGGQKFWDRLSRGGCVLSIQCNSWGVVRMRCERETSEGAEERI